MLPTANSALQALNPSWTPFVDDKHANYLAICGLHNEEVPGDGICPAEDAKGCHGGIHNHMSQSPWQQLTFQVKPAFSGRTN